MTKIVETDTNGNILATNTFVFDANERLTAKTYGAVGQTYRPIYEKNASGYVYPDNEIIGITLDGKFTDKVTKDGLISGMVSGAFAGAAMSMSGNPMFCFVAGTTVLTTLGKKAIETIQVGDTIPCVDHITGETAEKRVVTTTVNKVDRLIELDIDGEIIQCTETHPFQVKGRGWVNASNLAPNDVVYTKDWNTATVKSVNLLELDEPIEVFNFEVEDCHTYFVGRLNILVHNSCNHDKVWGKKKRQHWKDEAQKIVDNDQFGASMKSYSATDDNIARMVKGKAPIGWDGKSVELHHVEGITTNIDNFVEVTRTTHEAIHTFLHAMMKGII